MLLAIDVGNTNINAGVFRGKRLVRRFLFPDNIKRHLKDIDSIIMVSVAPKKLKYALRTLKKLAPHIPIYIVGKDIKVPLKSRYNASQIGQDRLVTAYAASKLYGTPVLIIDFGTAVTFDVVSKENFYLGGLILPGIKISLESLNRKTALLPEIEFKKARGFIGANTEDSILSGMIYGYSSMCEGLISRFEKRFKNLKIVATGGDSKLISQHVPLMKKIDRDLSLKGVALLAFDRIMLRCNPNFIIIKCGQT